MKFKRGVGAVEYIDVGRGSKPLDTVEGEEIGEESDPVGGDSPLGKISGWEGLVSLVDLVGLVGVGSAVGEGEYGVVDDEESMEGMNGEQGGCNNGNGEEGEV